MTNDQDFRDAQRAYADKLAEDAFAECAEDRLALYGFFGTRINARPDIVNNPFVRSYMQNMVGAGNWRNLEQLARRAMQSLCTSFVEDVKEQRPIQDTWGDYIRERFIAAPYLMENEHIRYWVDNSLGRGTFQNIVQYVRSFQERQSLRQAAIDLAKPGSERTAIVQMRDGKQVKIFVAEAQKQEPIRGRRMIDMED